jgi:hypothetical protein
MIATHYTNEQIREPQRSRSNPLESKGFYPRLEGFELLHDEALR